MTEIDVDISLGGLTAITVLDTSVSRQLISGPVALAGWSLRATSVTASSETEGTQAAPGAGTTIATLALPQGQFTISWTVEVSGTVAAAELNNFQLFNGATPVLISNNGNAVGQPYQQLSVTVDVPQGGGNVLIKNTNAATAASVYTASIVASAVGLPAIAELTSNGNPVAEISLPVGVTDTQTLGRDGVKVEGDITLTVIAGTFRGAIYVVTY